MLSNSSTSLNESCMRLLSADLSGEVLKNMRRQSDDIRSELQQTILQDDPAFTESRIPGVLPALEEHIACQLDEILRLLAGGRLQELAFVSSYAETCAQCYFPLESVLLAYRSIQKTLLKRLHSIILLIADQDEMLNRLLVDSHVFLTEYVDAISSEFTQKYVRQDHLLAVASNDHKEQLLPLLLQGYDESDGRVSKILRNAGYLDRRQSYCVAVAHSVDPTEMFHPGRAGRLVEAINDILSDTPVRYLIGLRANKVIIIFSHVRRLSGWSVPHSQLAERIKSELRMVGTAALIGVSNDVPSTSQIPAAHREAQLAIDLADVSHRVVQISEVSLQKVMLQLTGERLTPVLPAWCKQFYEADDRLHGALVKTLRAYANANMNTLKTAQSLSVHANTIYARFLRIEEISGFNARLFADLRQLLIVADCRSREAYPV